MSNLTDHPLLVFVLTFFVLSFSAWLGKSLSKMQRILEGAAREDFAVILAATLTLLALIIGFTFSMALNRYDQRKNYEEAEANAIGTEYLRVDLLPAADVAKVQTLLLNYLDQRVLFYSTNDEQQLRQIDAQTAKLQAALWSSVRTPAVAQPECVVALAVSGMNDVLNSQGYTQAAWWNRIPIAGWALMLAIAICSNVLVGFGSRNDKPKFILLLVLPFIVSIAFLLIADIESPRAGLIRVVPQNLLSLSQSLHAQ
ncbi:MAG: hypothetical protein ACLP51_09660 [Syntrophobacteraceae bacterium]